MGFHNWGGDLIQFRSKTQTGQPWPEGRQVIERVEGHPFELAVCLFAGRLALSEGPRTEKRSLRRGQSAFFLFDGICGEHRKGQRLQAQEGRASNRRLAGPCLFDFGWLEELAVQSLVTLQGSWLIKTRGG